MCGWCGTRWKRCASGWSRWARCAIEYLLKTAPPSEMIAVAHRRLAHHALAEFVRERPHRPPSAAMRRNYLAASELPKTSHRVRNQPLHRFAPEVQAAERGMDRRVRKLLSHVEQDVDDSRVRARAEYDHPLVLHVHRKVALVHDERVRFPFLRRAASAQVVGPSLLEA